MKHKAGNLGVDLLLIDTGMIKLSLSKVPYLSLDMFYGLAAGRLLQYERFP